VTAKYKSDIRSKEEKKKFLSIQKLSNEEIILQNKNKLLVCVDIEDEDKNQVQYCFVSREIVKLVFAKNNFSFRKESMEKN